MIPPEFKSLEHLKLQTKLLQHALILNRTVLSIGVDVNIAIFIAIVLGAS